MKLEHLPEVARLENICFSTPWSENALKEEMENPNAMLFVAVESGKVLGYGGMQIVLGEGFVTNIAVFKEQRGKGVGKAICEKLIENCKYSISLEVRESNLAAINLYENLGFEKVGNRKNFYQNPQENALIYTKYN